MIEKCFRGKWAAVFLCVVLIAAAMAGLAGCSRKYGEISLTEAAGQAETDAGAVAAQEEENKALMLEDAEGVQAAESQAVADLSEVESDLTTASGFSDVDETVYITDDLVNIRSGCGTEYSIVARLNRGDSVKRTGSSEGWSRILYHDEVCYVMSEYVSTENPDEANVTALENRAAAQETVASNGIIVAIDAGHQAKGNSEKEPIGPGSSTMKAKVASGAVGVVTKLPEYQLTLDVSEKVKRILEERGYQVVMIRETNDVNMSNAERAQIANESGASVFVRIHANSLDSSTVHGTLSMCQTADNPYNGGLHAQSYSLSKIITDAICAATGSKNRGVQETDTMSGINWCTIPVTIVEMGFMSNPEEDQKMAQDEYQELIAAGIANGIDAYFGK